MRILIVDDEPLLRYHLRSLLEEIDPSLEILEAENGVEALETIRQDRADAAFIDIRIPQLDGLSVMEQVKQEAKVIPWVVLSSYSEFDYAKKALRAGALGYALKPPSADEIKQLYKELATALLRKYKEQVHAFAVAWAYPEELWPEKAGVWYRCGSYLADAPLGLGNSCIGLTLIERSIQHKPGLVYGAARSGRYPFSYDLVCQTAIKNQKQADRVALAFMTSALAASRRFEGSLNFCRPLCILGSSAQSLVEAQEVLSQVQKILDYRAFFPPGLLDYSRALDLVAGLRPWEQALGEKTSRLVHDAQAADSSAFRATAKDLAIALSEVDEALRRRILRYLGQLFGPTRLTTGPAPLPGNETLKTQLFELYTGDDAGPNTIESLKSYLLKHFTERLSLTELAKRFSLSPNYLSSLFHAHTGKTFIAYLTELRLERAKELLHKGWSVKECSRLVGYGSERHFAQMYRRHYGYPPAMDKDTKQPKS